MATATRPRPAAGRSPTPATLAEYPPYVEAMARYRELKADLGRAEAALASERDRASSVARDHRRAEAEAMAAGRPAPPPPVAAMPADLVERVKLLRSACGLAHGRIRELAEEFSDARLDEERPRRLELLRRQVAALEELRAAVVATDALRAELDAAGVATGRVEWLNPMPLPLLDSGLGRYREHARDALGARA